MTTKESHQERHYREALPNIGRRCEWPGDVEGVAVGGTIIDVVKVRGGSRYVVEWDEDAPDWYSSQVSTAHGPMFVIKARQR